MDGINQDVVRKLIPIPGIKAVNTHLPSRKKKKAQRDDVASRKSRPPVWTPSLNLSRPVSPWMKLVASAARGLQPAR